MIFFADYMFEDKEKTFFTIIPDIHSWYHLLYDISPLLFTRTNINP